MTGNRIVTLVAAPLLAASVGLMALAPSACFNGSLDPFRCEVDGDCDPGRVCAEVATGDRYCVLSADAGTDGGADGGPTCPCDDKDPCNGVETCDAVGTCIPGMPVDCSMLTAGCTMGVCDPANGSCTTAPIANGDPCNDNDCTTFGEVCTAGTCAGGVACDDGVSCTDESCGTSDQCLRTPNEMSCGASEVCNPLAYPGATGCGAAPSIIDVLCPATSAIGTANACTVTLTTAGAIGVPGEAGRITCTARPNDVVIFADDFENEMWNGWNAVDGTTLLTSLDLPTGPAGAAEQGLGVHAELTLPVSGYDWVCLDFDMAYESGADSGEELAWSYELDGVGGLTEINRVRVVDFTTDCVMHDHLQPWCVEVTGGSSLRLKLEMDRNNHTLYIDDVMIRAVAGPRVFHFGGGVEEFDDLSAWTGTATGGSASVETLPTAPGACDFGGDSVLMADSTDPDDDWTLEKTINYMSCDVVDMGFEFAQFNTDGGERLTVTVDVPGWGAATGWDLDLNGAAWAPAGVPILWFYLARPTAFIPVFAGSLVTVQIAGVATGGGDRIHYADRFTSHCYDIPDPTLTALVDNGDGTYGIDVTTTVPANVSLVCIWDDGNDGPLTASGTYLVQ